MLNAEGADMENDRTQVITWDYPIRQRFTDLLNNIRSTGMVSSFEEGIKRVEAHEDGTLAMVHNHRRVRSHLLLQFLVQ